MTAQQLHLFNGLYLVVSDIVAARDQLVARGVNVSEVFHPGAPGAHFPSV